MGVFNFTFFGTWTRCSYNHSDLFVAIREDDRQFICDIIETELISLHFFLIFFPHNLFVLLTLTIVLSVSLVVIHTILLQSLSTSESPLLMFVSTRGDCNWQEIISTVVLLSKMLLSTFLHM